MNFDEMRWKTMLSALESCRPRPESGRFGPFGGLGELFGARDLDLRDDRVSSDAGDLLFEVKTSSFWALRLT